MPRIYFIVASMATGILVADRGKPSMVLALVVGVVALGALFAAWTLHRGGEPTDLGELLPKMGVAVLGLVVLGAAGIGFSIMGLRTQALLEARSFNFDGRVIVIEGVAGSDIEPSGRAAGFTLKADRIDAFAVRERVRVRVYGTAPDVQVGDRIVVEGKLRVVDLTDGFDLSLFRKRIVGTVTAAPGAIDVSPSEAGPVIKASNRLRRTMGAFAEDHPHASHAGLVMGLTIGDERLIPERVSEDFRTTSLSHLTAVSGANVAMVVGAVFLLLRALKVGKRAQIVIGTFAVVFFVAVTRWEPSVLRASTMAIVALSAYLFGRASDPMQGMGVAALGLLAYDPFIMWSIGFQLSFVAAAGILILAKPLIARFNRLPRMVAEALAVAVAAQLAVTPLLAFHFGSVSLAAVPANLVAFPLVAPITVIGLAGGVVGVFLEGAGGMLFRIAAVPAGWLEGVSRVFAELPWASVGVRGLDLWRLMASYLVVFGVGFWLFNRKRMARLAIVSSLIFLVAVGIAPAASSGPPEQAVRFTFFDVGQGDAALVEGPGGARVLIDGGSRGAGLVDRLDKLGIRRIDLVVLSHDHEDHYGGLAEVISTRNVQLAVGPPFEALTFEALGLEGTQDGERFNIGELVVDVLGPSVELSEVVASTDEESFDSAINDASVVVRVSWKQGCALFTGDLEEGGQDSVMARHPQRIRCEILKAPHHGSARISEEFVATVDPGWVVVPVGRNSYGHPTRTAMDLFERFAGNVLRTDLHGEVVLEVDAGGVVSMEP